MQDDFDSGLGMPEDELTGGTATPEMGAGGGSEGPAEAEAVFRDDLKRTPRNGRSLFGLLESLKAQKKTTEVPWVQKEFDEAWKDSPVRLRIEDL